MTTLSAILIDAFHRDGTIVADDAVTPQQLAALRADFDRWWKRAAHMRRIMAGWSTGGRASPAAAGAQRGGAAAAPRELADRDFRSLSRRRTNSHDPGHGGRLIGAIREIRSLQDQRQAAGARPRRSGTRNFLFTPDSNDDQTRRRRCSRSMTSMRPMGPSSPRSGSHKDGLRVFGTTGSSPGVAGDKVFAAWADGAKTFTMKAGRSA